MNRNGLTRDEEVDGSPRPAPGPGWGGRAWWWALPLGLVAAVAFLPVLGNGFVFFDDDENFLENPDFRGLGWPQVRWAWTAFVLGVYQPLAWMLLEAEYDAWGLDPRGYHLASLALHATNAVVLYGLIVALIDRATASARQDRRALQAASALSAALFAVHPLRVEVVAWASCQPYLPCALFSMLATLVYLRASDEGRRRRRMGWLAVSWILFASGLLSKAVAVSLPFVLLILDVYPLRRIGPGRWAGPEARRVWWEKVPFLALGLIFMGIALLAKRSNESLATVENYGIVPRVAQSCHGIWFYLVKTALPLDLTAYYPLPAHRADFFRWPFALAAAATVGASAAAVALRRRWPGLAAAWASYLVILAPNAGIARIGNQIAADRYSYVATIPWAVLAGYGLFRLIRRVEHRPATAAAIAAIGLGTALGLSALTWRLCRTWRTTETLWTNVLEHGGQRVATAHFYLGAELARQGRVREAMARQVEALRLDPGSPDAHNLLGDVLDRLGRSDEAFSQFAEAVRLAPDYAAARNNLGAALARRGELDAALLHLSEAVRLKPRFPLARRNLGLALARRGRLRPAIAQLAEAARLDPGHAETHGHLGFALAQAGRLDEAIAELSEGVRLRPDSAAMRTNLGLALGERGRLDEAIVHFAEATRLEPGRPDAHFLLGSVLARRGRRDDAAAQFAVTLRLDPDHPDARRALAGIRDGQGQGR